MLGLSSSTEVNLRVPKEKLYAKATLTPQMRDIIKDRVELVIWRNKLADSTVGISAGEAVIEIQVLEIQLRQQEFDKRVLLAITEAIPYKILFVLTFNDEAQIWIEASDIFYNTDWQQLDRLAVKFEGLNLDAVYENLVRQIACGRLGTDGDIEEAIDRDKRRKKLEREINALEKKISREKQFNRQVEMNGELKRLKKQKEELNNEI
jgi:hypothetical protein